MGSQTIPFTAREQRRSDRFDSDLEVAIAGAAGRTHNVSARGVYLETDAQQQVGSLVDIAVEFTLYGRRHRLLCEGKVVRVEPRGGRVGVAARLLTPLFEDIDAGAA